MSRIEVGGGDVVEVVLSWGRHVQGSPLAWSTAESGGQGCVLATKHLRSGDRFAVGEGEGCDALVPSEVLRAERVDLVTFDPAGALVAPPEGAQVWVNGFPAPAEPMALGREQAIDVTFGAFTLRARIVEAEAFASSFAPTVEASEYGGFALSALAHFSCLAALALFLAALGATDDDEIALPDSDDGAPAHRKRRARAGGEGRGRPGARRHRGGSRRVRRGAGDSGKPGAMGTPNAPQNAGHWSAAGDNPRELQSLSHEEKQALVKSRRCQGVRMRPI